MRVVDSSMVRSQRQAIYSMISKGTAAALRTGMLTISGMRPALRICLMACWVGFVFSSPWMLRKLAGGPRKLGANKELRTEERS